MQVTPVLASDKAVWRREIHIEIEREREREREIE